MDKFNSITESCSMKSIQKSLGITIDTESEDVESTLLPPPVLQLGKGDSIQENKVSSFSLFNKHIYNSSLPVNMLVIIPNDFDFIPIEKVTISTCQNLGIRQKLKVIKIHFFDSRKAIQQIEKIMTSEKEKYDEFGLNWFIIPTSFTRYYCQIKQISLREINPKVTQVTLLSTLKKKNFQSIVTKILLQITTKIGNVPWAPKIKLPANSKPMMIGIDVGKGKRGSRIIGYCATIN